MSSRSHQTRNPVPVRDAEPISSDSIGLLSPDEFQLELAKEISRSNRRQLAREFAILQFPAISRWQQNNQLGSLLRQAKKRIRISDSMGWHNNQLSILLPETSQQGALALANALSKSSSNPLSNPLSNQKAESSPGCDAMDIEIIIYPWDDVLISLAEELNLPELEPTDPIDGYSDPLIFENSQRLSSQPLADDDFGGHPSGNQAAQGSDTVAILERLNLETTSNKTTFANLNSQLSLVRRSSDRITRVEDIPVRLVNLRKMPVLKRAMDIGIAGAGLTLLTPVFIIAAAAIKTTSSGPVFFRQKREGKGGHVFEILKFRTMVIEAEKMQADLRQQSEQDGPAFKLTKDPRITWIGKYLRKSCVDELPQLWNVLKGDMSLVGPRPLPVGESYGCKAWHRSRLTVLPGLTCTWQASGRRREIKFDDWMRMDLDYIQKRSFWYDLKLLVRTAILAVLHRGSV